MKTVHPTPADRFRQLVAIGLAAWLTSAPAFAQTADADTIRRLEEENAALRRRISELERRVATEPAPAPSPVGSTTTTPPPAPSAAPAGAVVASTSTEPTPADTIRLSPFEVSSERDFGYLRTNSATATRIGTEIQKIPLSISVLSEDFVRDTGMRDIQDTLRYVTSSSGDPRMGIRAPGNSATPSGAMKLRGFPISQRLRNGVSRYTAYSLDNIDRVEVIKGPASIFYGLGFPGGVINFVTKKPQFAKIPTTFSYGYGGTGDRVGDQRATIDHNTLLSKNTAFRLIGAWDNYGGDKRYEYQKGFSITPSITINPFQSGKLRLNLEVEHTEFRRNQDDSSWTYNEQFFRDYDNPSNALLVAAGIDPASPTAKADWQTRLAGTSYGTWLGYKRTELNNPYWAAFQTVSRGAYYDDLNGNRVHDDQFNLYGSGSYTNQETDVLELTIDASPFSWIDARYVYTVEDGKYEALTSTFAPYGNGYEFMTAGISKRGDYRLSQNHQLDVVLKGEFFGVKNKLLLGGLYNITTQRFTGYTPFIYNNIPGASLYDPTKPPNTTTNIPPAFNAFSWGLAFQPLRDRNGNLMNAYEVFSRHDPASHVTPDIGRVTATDRGIVDAYKPERNEYYVNYLADLFQDRLHLMGGYRWTFNYPNGGQRASSNPPWYTGGPYLYENIDPSLYNAYGIGAASGDPTGTSTSTALGSYYRGTFAKSKGTSWMIGAAYDITKDITVYVSRSQSFRPNGNSGAIYVISALNTRAAALGLDPIAELQRIRDEGADIILGNETGLNTEFGVKTSLWDSKLVSTLSFFQLDREGEALEDIQRQLSDPLNYTGPNLTGTFDPNPNNGGVRWYSNTSKRRVEGAELEVIWTPVRNYQLVASGSWLWKAKTLLDSSINPDATDAATLTRKYYTYDFRMPGTPEYRLNLFNTYTLNKGFADGLRVSLGARYSSEMNINNSQNYDSKNGGLTAGDYLVFDGNLSYPWRLWGHEITTSLNVTNLLDEEYSEGGGDLTASVAGYSLSPPRTWMLINTLSF